MTALSTPNRDMQAALHFDRIDLRIAKKMLVEANQSKDPVRKSVALSYLSRARAQLRRTMNETEVMLYGQTRKQRAKAAFAMTETERAVLAQIRLTDKRYIPGTRVPSILKEQAV